MAVLRRGPGFHDSGAQSARREATVPEIEANGITMHYERQGNGEAIVMIPYLSADHACYAFQVAEYAKRFTCVGIDPRGAGGTDKPEGAYSTELMADDFAAAMQALEIERAHVFGLSLGAAVGLWLGIKYPEKVRSLSLHAGWSAPNPFLTTVIEGWQIMAEALGSVTETLVRSIFPWCFTPELYNSSPETIESLAEFARSRPEQPVDAFLRQSNAVIGHDVRSHVAAISVPTQITVGRHDMLCRDSAEPMKAAIPNAELVFFEDCAHAPIYQAVDEFNARTLDFFERHSG